MGAERKGRARLGRRRQLRGRARARRHEARRLERRQRDVVLPGVHRRQRRPRARQRGRSGRVEFAERAGQPALCPLRQSAVPGASGLAGSNGFCLDRLRPERTVRYPGHSADDDAHLTQQVRRECPGGRRPSGAGDQALCAGRDQVRDDPRQCAAPPPDRRGASQAAGRVGQYRADQPNRMGRPDVWHRHVECGLPVCERGLCRLFVPQTRHELPAAGEIDPRVCRARRKADRR